MTHSDLLRGLQRRFVDAGYETEFSEVTDRVRGETAEALVVWDPDQGKDFRTNITAGKLARAVSNTDFDAYELLPNYQAVWSTRQRAIECRLEAGDTRGLPHYQFIEIARLYGYIDEGKSGRELWDEEVDIVLPPTAHQVKISLTGESREFRFLRYFLRPSPYIPRRFTRGSGQPVMRLEDVEVETAQEAAEILDRLGNAVSFQIDLATDIPLFPARRRDELWRQRDTNRERHEVSTNLKEPDFAYDSEPMALYWYGRGAAQLPLLRFLALYQVVEFYYPEYSHQKAQRELRRRLKHPQFDVEDDADLAGLIQIITRNTRGRGYGSEQEQLHEVIKRCIGEEEMRDFFDGENRLRRFYSKDRNRAIPIVPVEIPVTSSGADLRPQVAKRLYAVRCRIVHSKSEDEDRDILLPFTRESALLYYDTQLMQFVARNVLIERSDPLL